MKAGKARLGKSSARVPSLLPQFQLLPAATPAPQPSHPYQDLPRPPPVPEEEATASSFPFLGPRFRKVCVSAGCLKGGQAGSGGYMVRVKSFEASQGQRLLGERGLGEG